ncbi:HAMP domain-containing histidine kinase [Paenibacillus tritici]|uniref:sensor histidine kinase n=1 Tax=Paenibacillus tritici TaxID=1873425 RepID=UPI001BA88398|nr:HAMP domain-containing sensor histidine kinase [Paenibacillus tritici]QUL53428.1 HAMP domain-containing histidine kinase [Paenibacillus tritici]
MLKLFGERGIVLKNKLKMEKRARIPLHRSVLGFKLMGFALFSVIIAVILYTGLSALGNYIADSGTLKELETNNNVEVFLKQFQSYVTANNLQSTDYTQIKFWLTENTQISFLYNSDKSSSGNYVIQFADKSVSVSPYATSTINSALGQPLSILIAAVSFFFLFLAFVRYMISDIKLLSHDMEQLTNGNLNHEVRLLRKDELGELARDINTMRCSIITRMEAESKAIKANQDLITALSHDLRTPLTKQLGYLELAMNGQYQDEASMQNCLRKVHSASVQIKSLSDELFSYFTAVQASNGKQGDLEDVDGFTLLNQLFMEYSEFLYNCGFHVQMRNPEMQEFSLSVDIQYLTRIMDNLSSNIKKYGDPSQPVELYYRVKDDSVYVHFENTVGRHNAITESANIGIQSAGKMAKSMNGSLHIEKRKNHFAAVLRLPVTAAKQN